MTCAAFSPDGKTLYAGLSDGSIHRWDVKTAKGIHPPGQTTAVRALAHSPDGRLLATGHSDGVIRAWDRATGKVSFTLEEPGVVTGAVQLAWGPEARYFVAISSNAGEVWSMPKAKSLVTFELPRNFRMMTAALSRGKEYVLVGGADQSVAAFDPRTGKRDIKAGLTLTTHNVYALAAHPRRPLAAAGGSDAAVRLWDVEKARGLAEIKTPYDSVEALAFGAGPDLLAVASSRQKTVTVYDPHARARLRQLELKQAPLRLAICPRGLLLAVAQLDHAIRVYDLTTFEEVYELKGHTGLVWGLEFAPDARTLASGSEDSTVLVWDVSGTKGKKGPALSDAQREACWKDLASAKGAKGVTAVWRLADDGEKAVAFLVKKLPAGGAELKGDDAIRARRAVRALQLAGGAAARRHLEALAKERDRPELARAASAALEHLPAAKK
jgi:WD40 repeat protein